MTTAPFGFQDIPAEEKAGRVRDVFDAVAPAYDLMNDLMSFGAHRLWKEAMVDALKPRAGMEVLDLAGGTGDIATRILRREPEVQVTVCDINAAMLAEGRDAAINRGQLHNMERICGDAEKLPFADRSFDACTMAFGLRNVTHTALALAEIKRVLRPGGQFLCLEFSPCVADWAKPAYDFYSFRVIPHLGKMVAGSSAPYQYLVESIRRFHTPEELARLMQDAGLDVVKWRNMSGGVVALHTGWRI